MGKHVESKKQKRKKKAAAKAAGKIELARPIEFRECLKCHRNYEYGMKFFPDDSDWCIFCENAVEFPSGYDFILEGDKLPVQRPRPVREEPEPEPEPEDETCE